MFGSLKLILEGWGPSFPFIVYLHQSTQIMKQGFANVAQTDLKLHILGLRPDKWWKYSHASSRPSIFFFVFLLVVLGVELRTLHIKAECFITELYPHFQFLIGLHNWITMQFLIQKLQQYHLLFKIPEKAHSKIKSGVLWVVIFIFWKFHVFFINSTMNK